MPRSEIELLKTQNRLQLMIKLAQDELEEVEAELASLKTQARLNESFFWKHVVGIVGARSGGITSAELFRLLTEEGHNISSGGLRVFLSRYRQRGKLTFGRAEKDRWELSSATAEAVARMGVSLR